MLIPIGDDKTGRGTTPFVCYAIIIINVAVFIVLQQAWTTREGVYFSYGYSVIPYEITTGVDLKAPVVEQDDEPGGRFRAVQRPTQVPEAPGPSPIYLTLLTAMFMHGGWMHIIGNMLYLWIFGDNVEDNFGHGKFLIFYLTCGIAASFAQILADPVSKIPNLGASGAIAGVLGAYLIMFPRNRVRTLLPIGFLITPIELPAVAVLGFWIVIQIYYQYTSTYGHAQGGVAYMAHIGGFAAGLLLCLILRRRNDVHYRYP